MYYLNKIIGVMMSPSVMGLVVLAVLVARRAKRRSLWVVLGLLWFWTSAIPGRILGLPLEREWLVDGEIPTAGSFPTANAIVCLGGGMNAATNAVHGANICPGGDRAWMAARLWKQGKAPKVICTGPGCRASTRGLLMDFGVPENAMAFLEEARNTEEEAKAIVRILGDEVEGGGGQRNCSVLLVTSAWHMRRAKLMFEKYAPGIEVVPSPTDFEATTAFDEGFDFRELLPNANFMLLNEVFLREWVGYLGYKWLR